MRNLFRGCGVFLTGAALLLLWGVSAAANFAHATQLAGSSPWAPILAAASAGSDILKAAAAVAFVAACSKRLVIPALVLMLIWGACTVWSVRSALGFISTTLADTTSERDMRSVSGATLKRQIEAEMDQISWLKREVVTANARRAETLNDNIDREEARLEALRQRSRKEPAVGDADPVGAMLATYLGVDQGKVRFGTALFFLALLEIVSNLGLLGFSHWLMPAPRAKKTVPVPVAVPVAASAALPVTVVAAADPAAIAASIDDIPFDLPFNLDPVRPFAKPHLVVSNPVSPLQKKLSGKSLHVATFLNDLCATEGGRSVLVSELQKRYSAWCMSQSLDVLPPWELGSLVVHHGCIKAHEGKTKVYLLPDRIEAAVAAA